MIYTVYVLYSRVHDQIYVGQTSNLIQRIHSHNTYGKDWTRKYRPWQVIYCEYFDQRPEARKRERQLKSALARRIIRIKIEQEGIRNGYIDLSKDDTLV